jgi:hypothetical protein
MEATDVLKWRKSTFSGNGGADCVEVGSADGGVVVRDTKNHEGSVLHFSAETWRRFAGQVKRS